MHAATCDFSALEASVAALPKDQFARHRGKSAAAGQLRVQTINTSQTTKQTVNVSRKDSVGNQNDRRSCFATHKPPRRQPTINNALNTPSIQCVKSTGQQLAMRSCGQVLTVKSISGSSPLGRQRTADVFPIPTKVGSMRHQQLSNAKLTSPASTTPNKRRWPQLPTATQGSVTWAR